MQYRVVFGWTTAIGVLAVLAGTCVAGEQAASGDPVTLFREQPKVMEFSGQLIVRPNQDQRRSRSPVLLARDQAARARLAGITAIYYPEVDEYIVNVPAGRARGAGENALAIELLSTGDYQYVEPNWTCFPVGNPNDPLYGSQWHHPVIGSPIAWNYTTGSSTIICAFTDTGIDVNHVDLAGHRIPGYSAPDNKAEVDGASVQDVNGHGTHVAGCAGAIGNNGTGVSGVNQNARLMMCRVTNSSDGSASINEILEAGRWAADHGASVVSASYSGVSASSIETTGAYIKGKGALYCYAAGNDGANLSGFDHADVIVVGASDSGDNRAGFSAYGKAVDVFSPGVGILSTVVGGGYQAWSGTSMATPVCNGALSMIWSAKPSLTNEQVQNILFYSSDDMGTPGNDDTYGWGRINVGRGVQWAIGPAPAVAVGDSSFALSGLPQTIDVLANDVALDGGGITLTSYAPTSAMGGTIARSVGTGPGGRDQLIYTGPANAAGSDTFTYTIQGTSGGPSSTTVGITLDNAANYQDPANPSNTQPGVDVSYYVLSNPSVLPNFSLLTPYATDDVANLNIPSSNITFATSGRITDVGAIFEGYITITQPAQYTIYSNSDDGSKVWIGSTLVVNNDGLKSPQAWWKSMVEKSGTIKLKAGTHHIRAEFFEHTGSAGLIVSLAGGGIAKAPIPSSMFSRDASPCPADFDQSGFLDIEDFDAFVAAFEDGDDSADFDGSGFVDIEDYYAFVGAFEAGC